MDVQQLVSLFQGTLDPNLRAEAEKKLEEVYILFTYLKKPIWLGHFHLAEGSSCALLLNSTICDLPVFLCEIAKLSIT